MAGILDRFLNGSGTDPINQAGGLEGYLNQFSVNPYWMPYLQAGNQFNVTSTATGTGGLLDGKTNPYEIAQPAKPTQQAPTNPADNYRNLGDVKISNVLPGADTSHNYQSIEIDPASMTFAQRKAMEGFLIGDGTTNVRMPGSTATRQRMTYAFPMDVYTQFASSKENAKTPDYLQQQLINYAMGK